jgi:hypothetical protein
VGGNIHELSEYPSISFNNNPYCYLTNLEEEQTAATTTIHATSREQVLKILFYKVNHGK